MILAAAGAAASVVVLAGGAATPWTLEAQHTRLGGMPGVCVDLKAEGTGGGHACLAGTDPLKSYGNVLQFGVSATSGEATTVNVVGGMITARARTVRARFADGTVVKLRAKRRAAWPKAFGHKVRWFGADVVAKTGATLDVVSGYDGGGKRVARFKRPRTS
jgi:hypothetical protein